MATPQGMQAYRAPSLLQPARLRDAIQDAYTGKIPCLWAFWCGIASSQVSRLVSQLGYDIAVIDWEHSAMGVETMTQMVHDIAFMSEGRTIPIVRLPDHNHSSVAWAMDAGASIMIPQVENASEAKHVIASAKYGAKNGGTRSAPPPGRFLPGFNDQTLDSSKSFWENVMQQQAIIIQVETLSAIKNLDAVLTECGKDIDVVWLGSLDCRVNMGLDSSLTAANDEPEWLEAVALYESTMAKHNKPKAGFTLGATPQQRAAGAKGKVLAALGYDIFAFVGQAVDLMGARPLLPAMDLSKPVKK